MDEIEEFELDYQDELEMLDELPPDEEDIYPGPSIQPAGPSRLHSTQIQHSVRLPDPINSPHLSQISFLHDESSADGFGGAPVNRRLFGTPKVGQRGTTTSTPLHKFPNGNNKMPAIREVVPVIQEIVEVDEEGPTTSKAVMATFQTEGLRSKRRLEKDLFGDIGDIGDDEHDVDGAKAGQVYANETYEDPIAKKARLEEIRDLSDIERIVEFRRQREATQNLKRDNLSRLQELIAFKRRNLSTKLPTWPFLPISRSDQQRIYVRYHSEDYEARELERVQSAAMTDGLLVERKAQIWAGANELVLKRTAVQQSQPNGGNEVVAATEAPTLGKEERLWVEKYKPRKYIDLLSDESTNRSLLYWLKMWDKVVFGKEFKPKTDEKNANFNPNSLNSFNKRTGKFESNGGWRPRRTKQMLNTDVDELGRPVQKVALLCGPPGLGKTTLAHTIARHAGYTVREVNASDDRSPDAFKMALENGTQMTSALNENHRPNCIILDEIDGAPRQSVEFLVKFVTDNVVAKAKPKSGAQKAQRNILKRPIICICNDLYDPALRALRQIAFVVNFPPINSSRLADRLVEISRRERLKTNLSAMISLAEKSGNDVRSCISTMQFFAAQKKSLLLHDVLNANLGQKDRHQGLFDIWKAVFHIQRPKNQLDTKNSTIDGPQVTMTDMSIATRVRNVLDVIHSAGDYERLTQGVYENFLQQRMPDPDLNGVVAAGQWFCFNDLVQRLINQQQNYSVYPYLQYGFVAWHLQFASLAPARIQFPMKGFEYNQKTQTQRNIFQTFRRGITCNASGVGQGYVVLLDTVPFLKRILSPNLRSVDIKLLSPKEQYDLKHAVEVMVDLGLTYNEIKSADSSYVFQMEPDLDLLAQYPGRLGLTLNYFGRQVIARQVELERIRRAQPKTSAELNASKRTSMKPPASSSIKTAKSLPNHLQRLQPKRIDETADIAKKAVLTKDFFGRITQKSSKHDHGISENDPIVKSPIWYRYKEGYNNAVRKDIRMNDLL